MQNNRTSLPEPNFIERDADKITQEAIAMYEGLTGKVLQPAQQERIMIDVLAYRELLIRTAIQLAAKGMLVNYATYPVLDHLGDLVGCPRLGIKSSTTVMLASMSEAKSFDVTIEAGTQIESKDGKVIFATLEDVVIKAGQLSTAVNAECTSAGIVGNGYLAGEINTPIGNLDYIDSFVNTTTTSGGADEEDEDPYAMRIKQAPEQFSNAGSRGAYKYLTESSHQDIIDSAVIKPQTPASIAYTISGTEYTATSDVIGNITGTHITSASVEYRTGVLIANFDTAATKVICTIPPAATVEIYPLTKDGSPTQAILDVVEDALSDETKRPLSDNLLVKSPEQVDYALTSAVTIYSWADWNTVKAAIEAKLNTYISDMKSGLGKDVIPSQILALIMSVDGVYNATSPIAEAVILEDYQWANCTSVTVVYSGVVNG